MQISGYRRGFGGSWGERLYRLYRAPGVFRSVSWLNLQAIYRFGPQARAQAFDEIRGFHADGPAMLSRLP